MRAALPGNDPAAKAVAQDSWREDILAKVMDARPQAKEQNQGNASFAILIA
jgi:hypothetical protein